MLSPIPSMYGIQISVSTTSTGWFFTNSMASFPFSQSPTSSYPIHSILFFCWLLLWQVSHHLPVILYTHFSPPCNLVFTRLIFSQKSVISIPQFTIKNHNQILSNCAFFNIKKHTVNRYTLSSFLFVFVLPFAFCNSTPLLDNEGFERLASSPNRRREPPACQQTDVAICLTTATAGGSRRQFCNF